MLRPGLEVYAMVHGDLDQVVDSPLVLLSLVHHSGALRSDLALLGCYELRPQLLFHKIISGH
jgi:hypothetical protein